MMKKHQHSAFFVDFFALFRLTQITNSRIKTFARSASNGSKSEKNVSCHILFIFFFTFLKKVTGPSTYGIHSGCMSER